MKNKFYFLLIVVVLLAGCASNPESIMSNPETIAQSLNGRKFAEHGNSTDNLFGLQAVRRLLRPFPVLCKSDGGSIKLGNNVPYISGGRAQDGKFISGIGGAGSVDCMQGETLLWRVTIGVYDGGFRSDPFLDKISGVTYFGYLRVRYETGSQVQENARKQEQDRIASEQRRQNAQESRERCMAMRTTSVKSFRDVIKNGDVVRVKLMRGLVVEVKRPLVLIQYDSSNAVTNNRQSEWIPIESVEPDIPHCF